MKFSIYLCLMLVVASLSCIAFGNVPTSGNQQLQQGCNSADVSFNTPQLSSWSCGQVFSVFLHNSGNCTITTGGALICDGNLRNCAPCRVIAPTSDGWELSCTAIGSTGTQIITDTYLLGPLQGTIATAITPVTCATPFATPQTIIPHTPVPCDSNSLTFNLVGPFSCGGTFHATLTTTTNCPLSSGGALVCNSLNRNCAPCTVTGSNPTLTYTCPALTSPGQQIVTATYQLGPYIGTIASAHDMGCPFT